MLEIHASAHGQAADEYQHHRADGKLALNVIATKQSRVQPLSLPTLFLLARFVRLRYPHVCLTGVGYVCLCLGVSASVCVCCCVGVSVCLRFVVRHHSAWSSWHHLNVAFMCVTPSIKRKFALMFNADVNKYAMR